MSVQSRTVNSRVWRSCLEEVIVAGFIAAAAAAAAASSLGTNYNIGLITSATRSTDAAAAILRAVPDVM